MKRFKKQRDARSHPKRMLKCHKNKAGLIEGMSGEEKRYVKIKVPRTERGENRWVKEGVANLGIISCIGAREVEGGESSAIGRCWGRGLPVEAKRRTRSPRGAGLQETGGRR